MFSFWCHVWIKQVTYRSSSILTLVNSWWIPKSCLFQAILNGIVPRNSTRQWKSNQIQRSASWICCQLHKISGFKPWIQSNNGCYLLLLEERLFSFCDPINSTKALDVRPDTQCSWMLSGSDLNLGNEINWDVLSVEITYVVGLEVVIWLTRVLRGMEELVLPSFGERILSEKLQVHAWRWKLLNLQPTNCKLKSVGSKNLKHSVLQSNDM